MTSTAMRKRKKSTRTERERRALRRGGRGKPERKNKMEITQKEINKMADKVGKVSETLREVNAMAFRLAKEGNRNGVFQLRGAFSGTLAAAQTADGFLTGLAAMFN